MLRKVSKDTDTPAGPRLGEHRAFCFQPAPSSRNIALVFEKQAGVRIRRKAPVDQQFARVEYVLK